MKKITLILFLLAILYKASSQNVNDLPEEFKNVAIQAFQKVTPATRQWFTDIAKELPAAKFDTAWAKKKLREKFGAADVANCGELFMVMMAYQKMVNKEAREDKKIARQDKEVALASQNEKLKADNNKIDQSRQEANEKANSQMTGASISLWTGVVSGTTPIVASTNSLTGSNNNINPAPQLNVKTLKQIDSTKTRTTKPQETQRIEMQKEGPSQPSEERKKSMNDAVKKLLDQMNQINKTVKL